MRTVFAILLIAAAIAGCKSPTPGAAKTRAQEKSMEATRAAAAAKAENDRASTAADRQHLEVEGLLAESYKLSASLKGGGSERAHYLSELCRISVEVRAAKAVDYCTEAFTFAPSINDRCQSDLIQSNVTAWVSNINPDLAMDWLGKIPGPVPGCPPAHTND